MCISLEESIQGKIILKTAQNETRETDKHTRWFIETTALLKTIAL